MTPAAPTATRPPRWRRLLRWLLRVVVVMVAVRVLLALLLPQLLALFAPQLGLRVQMRSAWLSLSGLSLRLQGVVAADAERPDAPPLFAAEDIAFDLSTSALLRGDLLVVDASVSKARVHLRRGADGALALPATWTATPAVVAPAPPTAAPPQRRSLRLPFRARSLRLHDVALTFVDDAAAPPRTDQLTLDVAVTDLGDPAADAAVSLRLAAPDAFDAGWLRATIRAADTSFAAEWHADLRDLRTARLAAAVTLPPAIARLTSLGGEIAGSWRSELDDAGVITSRGSATLRLQADGNEQLALDAGIGPLRTEPTAAPIVAPFTLALRAPGFVQSLRLDDAVFEHHADESGGRGTLLADGVTLQAAKGWLAEHGVTLPADGLQVAATFDASLGGSVSATVRDVTVRGGGAAWTLPRATLRDLRRDDDGFAIEAVEVVGPTGALQRAADGAITAVGATWRPSTAPAADAAAPATAHPPALALPPVRVGALRWTGADLAMTDAAATPPATLRLRDLDVHGDGLACGVAAPPGRLFVQGALDDAVGALQAELTIAAAAHEFGVDATIAADAMTLRALQPWLAPRGLLPTWTKARLRARAAVRAAARSDGLHVDGELADVQLADGDTPLLQLGKAQFAGLHWQAATLALGAWTLADVDVLVAPGANNAPTIAGVPLPAPAASPAPGPAAAAPPVAAGPTLRAPTVQLQSVAARWRRRDGGEQRFTLDGALAAADAASALPFRADLRAPGACDTLALQGTWTPAAGAASLQLDAAGLRGPGLAALLPLDRSWRLADGRLRARADVRAPADGRGALVATLADVAFADGDAAWFALERALLDVAAQDAEVLHVRSLAVNGVRARLDRDGDGWAFAGLSLAAAAAPADAPASIGFRLPRLRVDGAEVDLDQLELRAGAATPTTVRGTATLAPWDASSPATLAAPARLSLRLAAPPLLRTLAVEMAAAPFALQPLVDATVAADGVDLRAAFAEFAPKDLISDVADGALTAELHARIDLKRRDPQRFDFDRPIAGDLLVEDLSLRDVGRDAPLLRVDSAEALARAIDPATGDVLLRSLALAGIAFDVTRTADGWRLPGVRWNPAAAAAPTAAPASPAAPAAATTPEFAVEHLSLQGLRARWRDETLSPPLDVPLADAEIDVHQASTRAFTEPRPIAFDVSLRGGDVELERRVHAGNLLAGVVGSAARAATLRGNRHTLEARPLFDEVALQGRVEFAPFVRGDVRASVAAFELMGLRGLAKPAGVEIADGVLDQFVQLDLRGPDGVDVRSMQVFQWLSLTEPPNGPISTYLRLPAPLPTVLFLLRNDADEQRIPIALHLPAGGVRTSDVADAFAEAFAKVVADALRSATMRAAGVVTGMFDFLWTRQLPAPSVVAFAPGDPAVAAIDADIAALAAALAGDSQLEVVLAHDLGDGDVPRARELATPSREVLAARLDELRTRRARLEADRQERVADLDALYAVGRMQEARAARDRLLRLDGELDGLERTLDDVLAMLANDGPRAERRRVEAAAKALGHARLAGVAAALRRAVPGLADDRVILRPVRGTATADRTGGGQVTASVRRRTAR